MSIFRNEYESFRDSVIKKILTMDIKGTTYVPQGVCTINNKVIVSCYDATHKTNSVLFIYDKKMCKKIILDCKAHTGGIAYHAPTDSFYVTGVGYLEKSYVNRYNATKLLGLSDGQKIHVEDIYPVDRDNSLYSSSAKHSSPAYLTVHNNNLYVGNYTSYKEFDNSTLKKYKILSNGDISLSNEVLNVPLTNIQGVCLKEYMGELYFIFSRSFGRRRNSIINICKYKDGFEVINSVTLPSMLEQVNIYRNNIILLFESCSMSYRDTSLTVNESVYHVDFKKLIKKDDDYKVFNKGTKILTSNRNICIK